MRTESQIEMSFIEKLKDLKYVYREDIKDRASLEANFRQKFEQLNKVHLSDTEFARLKESIITPDVFKAAKTLREINTFKRDDDTPLQYTIVNTTDWCKNDFEVVNQLRINTENSNHRYDVILLINGVPVVQIELKALQVKMIQSFCERAFYGSVSINSLLVKTIQLNLSKAKKKHSGQSFHSICCAFVIDFIPLTSPRRVFRLR